MSRLATTVFAAAFFIGSAAMAVAAGTQSGTSTGPAGQSSGTPQSGASTMSDAQIRQQLQAQGYTVQSLKHERNYVEAKVAKGGQTAELRIDPQTGAVSQANEQGEGKDED